MTADERADRVQMISFTILLCMITPVVFLCWADEKLHGKFEARYKSETLEIHCLVETRGDA